MLRHRIGIPLVESLKALSEQYRGPVSSITTTREDYSKLDGVTGLEPQKGQSDRRAIGLIFK